MKQELEELQVFTARSSFDIDLPFSMHISYFAMPSVLLMLLVGRQEGIRPVKTEWWGTGVVICLERGADLHMAQRIPLPLTVSCCSKIQIGFSFLVPACPGCPGKEVVKWL